MYSQYNTILLKINLTNFIAICDIIHCQTMVRTSIHLHFNEKLNVNSLTFFDFYLNTNMHWQCIKHDFTVTKNILKFHLIFKIQGINL